MRAKLISAVMLSGLFFVSATRAQESVAGIGVALGVKEHAITILKVLPNTPASKAELSPGLVVHAIDGTVTDDKPLKDCVDMLRGAVGTKVKLEVVDRADGKARTVELTREKISVLAADGPSKS